jgi:hypothetical protein
MSGTPGTSQKIAIDIYFTMVKYSRVPGSPELFLAFWPKMDKPLPMNQKNNVVCPHFKASASAPIAAEQIASGLPARGDMKSIANSNDKNLQLASL